MGLLALSTGPTSILTGSDRINQIFCRADAATWYIVLCSPPRRDSHAALLGVGVGLKTCSPTGSWPRWACLKRMRKRHRSRWPRSPRQSRRSCGSGQEARRGRRKSPCQARWTAGRSPRHRQYHPHWCGPRSSGAGRTAGSAGDTRRRSWPRSRLGGTGWGWQGEAWGCGRRRLLHGNN